MNTISSLTPEKRAELIQEFFECEVNINDGRFGKLAKWTNNDHPENPNFMQSVIWTAHENGDKSLIIFKFALSHQERNTGIFLAEPHTGDFNAQVFAFWKSRLKSF